MAGLSRERADLLIYGASELATPVGPAPLMGERMRKLLIVRNGAVAIRDGLIVAVGRTEELKRSFEADEELDASGMTIVPGFVDPHTHLVFAGDRADEFEMRVRGATYLEIMAAGGGIMSTVRATRRRP